MSKNISPEISAYFSKIGKKSGDKLLAERGPEYFKKISRLRKTFGRQAKVENEKVKDGESPDEKVQEM